MRIGLYGGTFDPVHCGHLILARETLETLPLDEIVFLPAAISPHKLHLAPTPAEMRWEMLKLAIAGEPGFSADDLELRRSGPSFTIDTALYYREKFPAAEIFYLVGEDNLAALHTWHRIDDLLKMVNLIVLGRGETDFPHPYRKIPRRCDISASEIRMRVAKGLSIRYLVPERVADWIRDHQLYLESPHQSDL